MRWHKVLYEVWPDPMPTATYPLLVPEHVVMYVRDDADVLPDVPEGFSVHRTGHARYQCHPPCYRLHRTDRVTDNS